MRPTSLTSARRTSVLLLLIAIVGAAGCEGLDGRRRNREGSRLFRETKFVEATAQYEKALSEVESPTIHYNLGLAYSKINKPGADKAIVLDAKGSFACTAIPQTKDLTKKVCVRGDDKRYIDCKTVKDCPTDTYSCQDTTLCTLDSSTIASLAAKHFQVWLKDNPSDDATAKLMTQVWTDSSNFKEAIAYWEGRLAAKPNDPDIMSNLAGINLKAEDWRKSIEWYRKVAEIATDANNKLAALTYIGRVSRAKLASKTLSPPDSIELADLGIGALQKARDLAPKNASTYGLMASIFSLKSLVQGASFAGSIDRATTQDLLKVQGVLILEAKKAQEGQTAPAPAPAPGTGSAAAPTEVTGTPKTASPPTQKTGG